MADYRDSEKASFEKEPTKRRKSLWRWAVYAIVTVCLVALGKISIFPPLHNIANKDPVIGLVLHFAIKKRGPPSVNTSRVSGTVFDTWVGGPVVATNFADPAFIEVDGIYYAFATNKYVNPNPNQINIQVAVSNDFSKWNLTTIDALPYAGNWSTGSYVWAPDVVQLVRHPFSITW